MAGASDPFQHVIDNTYVPSYTYASGTYSNGLVWASDAALALGLPLAPSLSLGGTNYAFGGATTGNNIPNIPPSLVTQAAQYLASTSNHASANALYVVAGGGNDARAILSGNPFASVAAYVANVGTIVDELQAAGAQHIVVWNTPNLGLAPAVVAGGGAAFGAGLAATMNAALAARLAGEEGVSIFDIFGLGTSLSLGFANSTDACGAIANANCSNYVYWDGIHPTAAAHQAIANAFIAQAVPEASTWAMMILGFAGVGFIAYRRKSRSAAIAA